MSAFAMPTGGAGLAAPHCPQYFSGSGTTRRRSRTPLPPPSQRALPARVLLQACRAVFRRDPHHDTRAGRRIQIVHQHVEAYLEWTGLVNKGINTLKLVLA